jgi:hypothetical protein
VPEKTLLCTTTTPKLRPVQISKASALGDEPNAEERRKALRTILANADMSAREAARAAELPNANALYNFFNGRSTSLSAETYRKLARVIPGATVASLQGLEMPSSATHTTVHLKAEARVGAMRSTFELPLHEQTELAIPITAEERAAGAYAIVVRRPGAEEIYPEGTILVVMPVTSDLCTPANGRRFVLQRLSGCHVEVTVREMTVADGKTWLSTRSSNLAYDTAIEMPWPADVGRTWKHGEDRYYLAGIVIAAYIREC